MRSMTTGNGGPLCAKSGAPMTRKTETVSTRRRITILKAGISTNLQFRSARHPAIPRARALRAVGFGRWRKHVVVHRDHHRNEHDGVIEEMELDPRHPVLDEARRHGTA